MLFQISLKYNITTEILTLSQSVINISIILLALLVPVCVFSTLILNFIVN